MSTSDASENKSSSNEKKPETPASSTKTATSPMDPMVAAIKQGVLDTTIDVQIEKANISGATCKRVKFENKQIVYERDTYQLRTFVKIPRAPVDPWRAYGALKQIHESGGWKIVGKSADKKKINYEFVIKGTPPPPPPNREPIMTAEEFMKRRQYASDTRLSDQKE
ncbi:hypothetical protein DdX_06043 [Ditylenchus destructor]|uniref:Uncharacterized protein n=1 Tax=Ditylenchus destructor TaxID=166010 RepID=A0AAD4R692_9BILA|nr:hypothetical protein DdX_06043 [Ditylenchus destructor]